MVNVKELLDDYLAEGYSFEEAKHLALASGRKRLQTKRANPLPHRDDVKPKGFTLSARMLWPSTKKKEFTV